MIINSHVHLNTSNNFFFYKDYTLAKFLGEMALARIDIAFPCINPKVELYHCPNDYHSTYRHRVTLLEQNETVILKCKNCGRIINQTEIDPLRKYNLELVQQTRPYRNFLKPLMYISLSKCTIQKEIDFFETCYPYDFIGFKLHPWNDQVSVHDFCITTKKPVLIHCGIRQIEHPLNALNFARNNPLVKIVIAHAAALCEDALKQIAIMDNVFIDCCPTAFMYNLKETLLENSKAINSPEDIYYMVFDFVPIDKVLFGTDSPWGNSIEELKVLQNLKISKKLKEQILFKNAIKAYGL